MHSPPSLELSPQPFVQRAVYLASHQIRRQHVLPYLPSSSWSSSPRSSPLPPRTLPSCPRRRRPHPSSLLLLLISITSSPPRRQFKTVKSHESSTDRYSYPPSSPRPSTFPRSLSPPSSVAAVTPSSSSDLKPVLKMRTSICTEGQSTAGGSLFSGPKALPETHGDRKPAQAEDLLLLEVDLLRTLETLDDDDLDLPWLPLDETLLESESDRGPGRDRDRDLLFERRGVLLLERDPLRGRRGPGESTSERLGTGKRTRGGRGGKGQGMTSRR